MSCNRMRNQNYIILSKYCKTKYLQIFNILHEICKAVQFVNIDMVLTSLFCNSYNEHYTNCIQIICEIISAHLAYRKWLKAPLKPASKICVRLSFGMPHEKVFLRCGMALSMLPDVKSHCLVTQDKLMCQLGVYEVQFENLEI